METWANVKGFDTYQVSDQGQVRSIDNYEAITPKTRNGAFKRFRAGRILAIQDNGNGYKFVYLGRGNHRYVHRLMWEGFKGELTPGMQINHINCNRGDNRLENIELVTPRQNQNRRKARYIGVHTNDSRYVLPYSARVYKVQGLSYKTIGHFETKQEAHDYRQWWLKENKLI